ncbi:MAG: hypothetical protein AB8H86_26805 [Polyangiales bacterium]
MKRFTIPVLLFVCGVVLSVVPILTPNFETTWNGIPVAYVGYFGVVVGLLWTIKEVVSPSEMGSE